MATHARQQYFADEHSLSKENREFSIADEIQQKINGIEPGAQVNKIETVKVNGTALVPDANKAVNVEVPEVIDNLYTVDPDNALSAKQGKLLYDYIQNIASRGRFLSNWNSATGLPMTNPSESPYPYKAGDYFVVSNVAGSGGTNYRPDGSSYIIGQASTVAETEDVSVSDFYFYDGTNWLLLSNSGRQIAIDTSLSTTSTNPVENRVVTNALNGKQETLIAGSNIQIAADGKTISATDTTYSAGTGISIDANNVISSTVSPGATYTAGSGIDITSNVISADTSVVATQTDLAGKQDVLTAGTNIQIDTTTNTISATDTTYNAGKGIEIGDVLINGRQGPSPDGFHVPSEDDLRGLKTAMDSIFSAAGIMNTGNNWRINLHLPFAGIRYYTNGTATSQSTTGCYASSTPDIVQGYDITVCQLLLKSSSVNINILNSQSQGFSIRAFKDTFETPTSSWTVILGTLGSGGIFWNQTDGLISVTSNGTTGYTIMDKNLGATVVYSDGDTLSEANCGYYYQRGNDYGFPRTGSVTTSSTQVDASNYGPSNHYSSSTFITGNVWDSSQNGDLWGDITGTYTQENAITNTGVTSVNGQTGDITIQTGGNYSAGTGINISNQNVISADTTVVATQTDLANKQGTLTASTGINIDANNQISNTLPGPTIAATAPTGTEGALWYDTTNDVLMAYNGTAWKEAGTQMKILSYGHSTWQDFLNAYNENAVVYCRASSNSNPGTGNQGRMAFMAYININSSTGNPQEVEFQYYRSRSDHNSAANQLDEVYVYKLTGSGIWSVTQRDTAAKPIAGTGIGLTYNSSGMTISADTTVLATKTDLNSKQDTLVSGTNIKTVNNESLLGSGNITISAPTYTAGEGIKIGTSHLDNQGPCEYGFHIPLNTELQTLFNEWISLGFTDTQSSQFLTYLHIPVGRRDFTGVSGTGDQACLWGANGMESYGEYWVMSVFDSTEYPEDNRIEVSTIWGLSQCFGYPIRAFKDTPIVPDNSWTAEYQGTGNAGIFHNSTLGLISVSSDGTNWITFKDKNEGATTVYNYGDTITDANLGNVYQRGNNYGFPFTGNITTSSGTVDASNYGPGNYYSSSTFITRTNQTYSQPRDNSGNRNLWGGSSKGIWIDPNGTNIINAGVLSVNGKYANVSVSEFIPQNDGWRGQTLLKGNSGGQNVGYRWGYGVLSGDGKTYTIKVSNSDPASGTSNTIITLVI